MNSICKYCKVTDTLFFKEYRKNICIECEKRYKINRYYLEKNTKNYEEELYTCNDCKQTKTVCSICNSIRKDLSLPKIQYKCKYCNSVDPDLFLDKNRTTCKICINEKRRIKYKFKDEDPLNPNTGENIPAKSTWEELRMLNVNFLNFESEFQSQMEIFETRFNNLESRFKNLEKQLDKIIESNCLESKRRS